MADKASVIYILAGAALAAILLKKTETGQRVLNMIKPTWTPPEDNPNYQKWAYLFDATEKNLGMPKNLLVRVAWQESRFRSDIINCEIGSSAGAMGIMQIVPRWHPEAVPCDPAQAIPYAGAYLYKLKQQFSTWDKALAAYNWGPGNVSKLNLNEKSWLDNAPGETRQYVSSIQADIGGLA